MEPVRDATKRFSNRAEAYVRSRPRYPASVVAVLAEGTGLHPGHRIVDVGCGTGLSAEPFLRHGNPVIGVEPNAAMREAGARALAAYPAFRAVGGVAEALPLADGCADYVIAGQAFHWFDPDLARAEFGRILRADGWAVILWNTRPPDRTPFLRAYEELLLRHGTDYREVRDRSRRSSALGADPGEPGLRAFFGGEPARRVLENAQDLGREDLRERVRSASYTPAQDSPGHAPMMEAVDRLFDAHQEDGRVTLAYDLEVYFGRPGRAGA